jgi:hypothetical protein
LSVLIPRFGLPRDGGATLHGFWERSPNGESPRDLFVYEEWLPRLLLLLALACLMWWAAAVRPLLRRGRWLTLGPALCLATFAPYHPFETSYRGIAWPLGWPFLTLLLAGLGLVLVRTIAHRRLGRAMCSLGGLLILGILFFPVTEDHWLSWRTYFEPGSRDKVGLWVQLMVVLWVAMGPLLLWIGRARKYPSASPTIVACTFALTVVLSIVTSQLAWLEFGGRDRVWWKDVLGVLNGMRMELRAWVPGLLIGTGLFAWIVGAREEATGKPATSESSERGRRSLP